jgi:hypothetical protein
VPGLGRKLQGPRGLAQAFEAMDTNANGTVDLGEFRAWWRSENGLGAAASDSTAEGAAESTSGPTLPDSGGGGDGRGAGGSAMLLTRKIFTLADVDCDGYLSHEEFGQLQAHCGRSPDMLTHERWIQLCEAYGADPFSRGLRPAQLAAMYENAYERGLDRLGTDGAAVVAMAPPQLRPFFAPRHGFDAFVAAMAAVERLQELDDAKADADHSGGAGAGGAGGGDEEERRQLKQRLMQLERSSEATNDGALSARRTRRDKGRGGGGSRHPHAYRSPRRGQPPRPVLVRRLTNTAAPRRQDDMEGLPARLRGAYCNLQKQCILTRQKGVLHKK